MATSARTNLEIRRTGPSPEFLFVRRTLDASHFKTVLFEIPYELGLTSRSGEIGIRTRLKIWRAYAHVGSIPTSGTNISFAYKKAGTNSGVRFLHLCYARFSYVDS